MATLRSRTQIEVNKIDRSIASFEEEAGNARGEAREWNDLANGYEDDTNEKRIHRVQANLCGAKADRIDRLIIQMKSKKDALEENIALLPEDSPS